MRLRQRYSLPELLTLASSMQPYSRNGAWKSRQNPAFARLQQVIRLARHGLREYSDKLDSLDHRLLDRERESERLDSAWRGRERYEERTSRNGEDCEEDSYVESQRLSRQEIHRIFERLAIHRHELNSRGYPYTDDVNREREEIYSDCEDVEGREVEEAWDDWKDTQARRLFGRHSRGDDSRREEEKRDERETRREVTREATGEVTDDIESFAEALRLAFDRALEEWQRKKKPRRRRESNPGDSHPRPDRDRLFQVFDEVVITREEPGCWFTDENLPRLEVINLKLTEYGQVCLDDEDNLRTEWREYVVAAAVSRKAAGRPERKDFGETVNDVEAEVEVIETRPNGKTGFNERRRRSKRKP